MQLDLFNAIKVQLETISALKHVARWNSQFMHEGAEIAHDFPNAFIEFTNIIYEDYTKGVQRYEMDVVIHLGFKSFTTDDTAVFTLKDTINAKLHMFSSNNAKFNTRLLRRAEDPKHDHGAVEDFQLVYRATGNDFGVNTLPDTDANVNDLIVNLEPIITNEIIRTAKTIP